MAQKELSAIIAWENTKKADIEAKLRLELRRGRIFEKFDKKKAEYAEKMKNKAGLIHKQAKEKRAMVEAKKSEDNLKAEELAAKYRAIGTVPKKLIARFGGANVIAGRQGAVTGVELADAYDVLTITI
ncbi:remorin family protein [Tanacetum coccineum]|uniref:Remorin family protein n=1 Tax=Tanacetum coccineum TaxID=301880 RepID=A0ABQ4WU46_9ASTR